MKIILYAMCVTIGMAIASFLAGAITYLLFNYLIVGEFVLKYWHCVMYNAILILSRTLFSRKKREELDADYERFCESMRACIIGNGASRTWLSEAGADFSKN